MTFKKSASSYLESVSIRERKKSGNILWTRSNCHCHFLISLEKTAFCVGRSGKGQILNDKGQVCVWDNLPCLSAAKRGFWGKKI